MEYEPTLKRIDLKDKHIVQLAIDRGMTEKGEDRDDDSEGEELDADELINAIKEGTDNLKSQKTRRLTLTRAGWVAPGKASISCRSTRTTVGRLG